ncbi:MAG: Ig-like domain-containing protein [Erysipelotrichaceae bacterium]|nr:Ig-like domain-containing protein [Erysipelotrichaceae bacterium]
MDEKKKKTRKILLFVIIGLVVLALIAGLVFFLTRKYTVTFDSAGGTPVEEQKVGKGKTVTRPQDPVMEGYDFNGWFYNDKEYNFNSPVKQSFTLTARWNEAKYVTFVVDGEEIAKEHILNGRVSFPTPPAKEGYAFVSWKDPNGNDVPEEHLFSDNITLTATYRVFIPITSIRFEKASYSMERGETLTLKLKVEPSNWVEVIGYTTSNSSVATVTPEGVVTANGGGTAVITVNTESGKSASVEINVKVSVKSMKFEPDELIFTKKGDKTTPKLVVDPEDTTDKIEFTSSDAKIVVANKETGELTAVGYGTATVTATAGKKKATLKVSVTNPAKSISVADTMTINAGETKNLGVKITATDPKEPTTSVVTYVSSNTDVAKVDGEGNVTGLSGGTSIITVSTDNGLNKKVTVYVNQTEFTVVLDQSHTIVENYLFHDGPYLAVKSAKLVIAKNGNVTTETPDPSKLTMVCSESGLLSFNGNDNKIAVSQDVSKTYKNTEVYFTYTKDGTTYKSAVFKITVEPVLKIKSVSGGDFSGTQITIPAGEADVVDFTVNITVANPTVTKSGAVTAAVVDSKAIKCQLTYSSGSGQLKIKTKGGQEITLTVN